MADRKQTPIRFTEEVREQLLAINDQVGIPIQRTVSDAVSKYLSAYPKLDEYVKAYRAKRAAAKKRST